MIALALLVIATEPCADPVDALNGFSFPATNATGVPTNATPIIGDGGALELRLVGPDGGDIASSVEQFVVGGAFGEATLRRVIPAGDLVPGQTITVVADGQVRSTFTVGDGAIDAPPAAPGATLDGAGAGGACPPSLTIGIASEDGVLFVGLIDGQPTIGAGARLDGLSSTGKLVLFGTGSATVNVAGVDLAGNVGASTPIEVQFPAASDLGLGCAASPRGATDVGGLALLALGLAVRARRRR